MSAGQAHEDSLFVNPSKYVLKPWDGKKNTFNPFRKDVLMMTLELNFSYISDAGRALFEQLQELAAAAKLAGTVFQSEFSDHSDDVWKDCLKTRESGRVMGRMAGLRTRVLKNAFGANFTDWKKSGFKDAAELLESSEIALEDFLLEKNKIALKKLQDAIFSKGAPREDCPRGGGASRQSSSRRD